MAVMSPEAGIVAVPRSAGVRTVPAAKLLAATTMLTRLDEDWNSAPATAAHTRTRAMPRPICQGRRWWVPLTRRSPLRCSTSGGDTKAGRAGVVVVTIGSPFLSCSRIRSGRP